MRLDDLRKVKVYHHIVLSPHLDDAALSMGGTIAKLTGSGLRVLVVTLCAGLPRRASALDLARDLEARCPRSAVDYVLERRMEDSRALERLGADHYWESSLDAIFRYPERYSTRGSLFSKPHPRDRLRGRARLIAWALAALNPHATYYAPLGVGSHVDHRILAEAASAISRNVALHYYEDFPYVTSPGALEEALRRHTLTLARGSVALGAAIETKIDAIDAYRSQLRGLFGSRAAMRRRVRDHAGSFVTERFWRPIRASIRASFE